MIGTILAGGENRRLPVLKGFLTVNGKTILEHCLGVLGSVFNTVVISTNMPEKYCRFGVPLIGDLYPARGPMTGIASALIATGADALFVVACDMPFISRRLVAYLTERYRKQRAEGAKVHAVIPVFRGKPEPLFGIYTQETVPFMESMIAAGTCGLAGMLETVRTLMVAEEELKAIDPDGAAFLNINTPEDYERIGGKICLV